MMERNFVKQRMWFVLIVFILLPVALVYADNIKQTIARLLSDKPLERQAAFYAILGKRTTTIKELISVVNTKDIDKSFQGPLHRAVDLLGKLRAKEAVKPLSNILMYVPEGFGTDEMIPSEAYYVPAVALREIGYPSIEKMMLIIRHSQKKEERNLAAWVIMEIEGKKQALNRMAAYVKEGGGGKNNFMAAKKHIENYKPIFCNPLRKK